MGLELERVEKKHRCIEQKIREAQEDKERGIAGAKERLQDLEKKRSDYSKDKRIAARKDEIDEKKRNKEKRRLLAEILR